MARRTARRRDPVSEAPAKVSLIATVLNAADYVPAFLESVRRQTRMPDEIVIVDGGSTDGTIDQLLAASGIMTFVEPDANIPRGRNIAIAKASHDVIAVADADCEYDPRWLESLIESIDDGAMVAMGWYEPIMETWQEACTSSLGIGASVEQVDASTFLPSARSVAFRREAIDMIGGYPEWLPIGEDRWVGLRWRERGVDMRFVPGAIARWRPRPTLVQTWTQYFRYARGDGLAGMYPQRYLIRFVTYAGLAAVLRSRRTVLILLALAGGVFHARKPVIRAWGWVSTNRERVLVAASIPALMGFMDLAKMTGYLAGLLDLSRGRAGPPGGRRANPD